MRIRISFDSADTERVREMCVALHRVGLTGELRVGLNGPECWEGETPHLQPWQFASIVANLVKWQGDETIADHFTKERAS